MIARVSLIALMLVASVAHAGETVWGRVPVTGGVIGSGTIAQMEASEPDVGDMWLATNNDAADCATGSGTLTIWCGWDGANWKSVGVAASGLTNPLAAAMDLATYGLSSDMGSAAASQNIPELSITNPTTTTMGAGVTWGSDQTAKNRPSGTEIDTRNHLMGWFYNKDGVNGSIVSSCESAWDWSHETNFRTTAGTADDQWVELNFDLFPPKFTMVPTGVSGSFSAGDYIEFSGGGFGKVTSYSGGTLTYVHTTAPCTANAETITNRTQTGSGTVASLTSVQTSTSHRFRPMQFEWDVPDGEARWAFSTDVMTGTSTFRIRDEGVAINSPDALTRTMQVWRQDGTQPVALIEFDEAGTTNSSGNADVLESRIDFGSNSNSHTFARNIHILSPLNGGSFGSRTTTLSRYHAIHIDDMKGWGSVTSSPLYIAAQTCGSACTDGTWNNMMFAGGNWNDGHIVFGTSGALGDHFWRDQTNERWRVSTDADPTSETDGRLVSEVIASGTVALDTDAITSESCDTSDTGITATGVASTDVLSWSFNGDVTAVTGYAPVTTGALSIYAYPGTNTVNFKVCNPTSSSITPGSAVTLNWIVTR